MESIRINNHIYNENKNHEEKNNPFAIHKQYLDDSETYENSLKFKTENSEKNNSLEVERNKNLLKSISYFPKKIYLEKPEIDVNSTTNRRCSMEQHLEINDLVPLSRPLEIHLVPSKLCLNKKGTKDLKFTKNNKILLMSNNDFISCPNSEEESDLSFSPSENFLMEKISNIKKTRKNLQKIKNGNIPKALSGNLIESNCKIYQDDMKIESDSEKDSFYLDYNDNNDNIFLYDDNDYINNNINSLNNENRDENKNIKESDGPTVINNRINSCSILDVLKNGLSFDDLI